MASGAGIGTQAGGTVLKLIGIWMDAGASDREDDLTAADAATNARRQHWSAADARARGDQEAQQVTLAGGDLARQQGQAYAASGVVSSSGTAAETQAETYALTRLDAAQTQNNAMREAWGHEQVATNFEAQGVAAKARKAARGAKTFMTSVGTVLGDAGSSMGSMSGGDMSSMAGSFGGGG